MNPMMDRQVSFYKKSVTPDATYGNPVTTWVPVVAQAGSPVIAVRWRAEVQDVLPSRAESSAQGLSLSKNPSRLRMRWRSDIDSSMRVTVHGDSDVEYQIVSGPAEIGGRRMYIELVIERYSSE